MRYKVNPEIRAEREAATRSLYDNELQLANSEAKERIYKGIKAFTKDHLEDDEIDAKYVYNEMLICLEYIYKACLIGIKTIYKNKIKNTLVSLENILYSRDGKTLQERVEHWCDVSSKFEVLFGYLCRIIDTETNSIMVGLLKEKLDFMYAMVVGRGECADEGGPCEPHIDFPFKVQGSKEEDYPPFHPMCECIVCFYTEDEVEIIE